MSKYRVPIAVPAGQRVMLTQVFGPVDNPIEPAGPNGEPHFHYGIDLVSGDDHHTYGLPIVCPFPNITVTEKVWNGPMNDTGNGIVGSYTDDAGVVHTIVCWHVSKISDGIEFTEGQVMGYIGNAGNVSSKPSLADPYAGAHLHLGYKVNGVWSDPLQYFDLSQPYPTGPTPQVLEMPPANWLVAKIEDLLKPFISAV